MAKWAIYTCVWLGLAATFFVVHGLAIHAPPANALATAAGRFRWIELPVYLFAGTFTCSLAAIVCLLTALVQMLRPKTAG